MSSTAVSPNVGLTQARKRHTPVLDTYDPLPTPRLPTPSTSSSPSSLYSDGVVSGITYVPQSIGRGEYWGGHGGDDHGTPTIRLVFPDETVHEADPHYSPLPPPLPPKQRPLKSALAAASSRRMTRTDSRSTRSSVTFSLPPSDGGTPSTYSPSVTGSSNSETSASWYGSRVALLAKWASRTPPARSHSQSPRRSYPLAKRSATVQSASSMASSFRYTTKFPDRWFTSQLHVGRGRQQLDSADNLLWTDDAQDPIDPRTGKRTWTPHKWCLLLSVTSLFGYGMAAVVCAVLTWLRAWPKADVVLVTDGGLLTWITVAGVVCLATALVGLTGAILNSRPILAAYNLCLWLSLTSILVVGYMSYKKQALALDRKVNQAWSQWYDDLARLRIQDGLHCCGFYSPIHEATFSKQCYPRTSLPGCKSKLYRFERGLLRRCYLVAFSILPAHFCNILVALICSNHVNRTFGKGLMPRQYRLNVADVRENAISVLRFLPALPHEAARNLGSCRSDGTPVSTLASLSPLSNPRSGLLADQGGNGLGLGISTEDGSVWDRRWPGGKKLE